MKHCLCGSLDPLPFFIEHSSFKYTFPTQAHQNGYQKVPYSMNRFAALGLESRREDCIAREPNALKYPSIVSIRGPIKSCSASSYAALSFFGCDVVTMSFQHGSDRAQQPKHLNESLTIWLRMLM